MHILFKATLSLLACCCAFNLAQAQENLLHLQEPPCGAQFRDALIAPDSRIFAAAYDKNQLWIYSNPAQTPDARIPVGKGPVALALNPKNNILAIANRLDNTATLLRLPDATVYATLPLGKGPTDIATLPDGAFATANSFANSLSIIDPQGEGRVRTIENIAPVPKALTTTPDHLALIAHGDQSLNLIAYGNFALIRKIPLEDTPTTLCATPTGQLYIATTKNLYQLPQPDAPLQPLLKQPAYDLLPFDNAICALTDHRILLLNTDGAITNTFPINIDARRIIGHHRHGALLAPAQRRWTLWRDPTITPAPPHQQVPAAPSTLEVVEADNAHEISHTPETPPAPQESPEPTLTKPAPKKEEPLSTPETPPIPPENNTTATIENNAPAPQPLQNEAPETRPTPAPPESKTLNNEPINIEKELKQSKTPLERSRYQRAPIPTGAIRAPRPGRQPGAVPMGDFDKRTITDAMKQPTQLGAPGVGFQAPDWTEPLRDVQAGVSKTDLNTGKTVLQDAVKLRLGEMLFQADSFSYTDDQGEYSADGGVHIQQGESELQADRLTYHVPDPSLLPQEKTLFLPELDAQGAAKRRLTLGHVWADNLYLYEPTREMHADVVDFDFATHTGELFNVKGRAGIYYYAAEKITITGAQSLHAENVWITTCDEEHAYYKLRLKNLYIENGEATSGTNARVQVGKLPTPLYLPKWRRGGRGKNPWNIDFDSGRRAELGYYINIGHRNEFSPDWALGPRIYATEKQGVGLGADWDYDYTKSPASRLYGAKGDAHALYTTKDRHYLHWRHRWEYDDNLVLRIQAEHWGDAEFYKDFFYDDYRNRTTPQTFANLTYRQPGYIATSTAAVSTHGWTRETERLPEATFHLLERPLDKNLYLSFDTINGYNNREPFGEDAARSVNVARLTYPLAPWRTLCLTPFLEAEGAWYSKTRNDHGSQERIAFTTGATLQTRLHRVYGPNFGFAAFKHIVAPSLTYSYRPSASMPVEDTPRFDALDNKNGLSRIESKLDNILYGRDEQSGEVWQVGRLTLYQGNDFWNENRKSDDYEIEIDLRPRPWWGLQLVGERHIIAHDMDLDEPYYLEQLFYDAYERILDRPFNFTHYDYGLNTVYGDYDRLLTQLYYDDTTIGGKFSSRIGFAYTETRNQIYNRELLYGLGYRLGEKWGLGFEHRYDFETNDLRSQSYELRRSFHCIEAAIRVRDRESGTDIDFELNITAFPGSKLKF